VQKRIPPSASSAVTDVFVFCSRGVILLIQISEVSELDLEFARKDDLDVYTFCKLSYMLITY
jgi:hypothetical protein